MRAAAYSGPLSRKITPGSMFRAEAARYRRNDCIHAARDLDRNDHLRAAERAREALLGRLEQGDPLPRAAREGRLAGPPQAGRRGRRRGGRLRGARQGVRDLPRPIRGPLPRGARVARSEDTRRRSRSRTSSTSTRSTPSTSTSPTTSARRRAPSARTRCSRRRWASSGRSRSPASCSATARASPRSAPATAS